MNDFPPPSGTDQAYTEWSELVVGFSKIPQTTAENIQKEFWASIVPELSELRPIEINQPDDEAWFHLRRTMRLNKDEWTARHSFGRIEIMRLKTSAFDENALERVRKYPESLAEVVCAGWWPVYFLPHHDNAFLSFLQKVSLLRVVQRYTCDKSLSQICGPYHKCPHCRKAYGLMTDQAQPWHSHLSPWLEHMARVNMPDERSYEYAHWFGHILSGGLGK